MTEAEYQEIADYAEDFDAPLTLFNLQNFLSIHLDRVVTLTETLDTLARLIDESYL